MCFFFRTRGFAALLVIFALALDFSSKQAVLASFGLAPGLIAAPLPFFNLVLVWNRGISFGMLGQHADWMPGALLLLTSLLTMGLAIWLWRTPRLLTRYGLALVIGGALGNIHDRLRYGAVVDFLDFHAFGAHWPAFNLADSFIFVGVVLLLLDSVLENRKPCEAL